jgi:putative transposase
MPKKTYRPEEIIAKLREAEVLLGQGKKVPKVVKAIGISEVSSYRWRKEYDGLKVSQAKRLKDWLRTLPLGTQPPWLPAGNSIIDGQDDNSALWTLQSVLV